MDKINLIESAFKSLRFSFYAKEFPTKKGELIICIYDTEKNRDAAKKPNKKEEIQMYSSLEKWSYKLKNIDGILEEEGVEFDDFKEALLDLATNLTSQFLEGIIFSQEIIEEMSEIIPIDESGNCLN